MLCLMEETFLINHLTMLRLMEETYLNQSFNNYKGTYVNILKITNDQGDDYTTGCQLDYPYFKEHYKMKTIDLSKQPALDAHHVLKLRSFLLLTIKCCLHFAKVMQSFILMQNT